MKNYLKYANLLIMLLHVLTIPLVTGSEVVHRFCSDDKQALPCAKDLDMKGCKFVVNTIQGQLFKVKKTYVLTDTEEYLCDRTRRPWKATGRNVTSVETIGSLSTLQMCNVTKKGSQPSIKKWDYKFGAFKFCKVWFVPVGICEFDTDGKTYISLKGSATTQYPPIVEISGGVDWSGVLQRGEIKKFSIQKGSTDAIHIVCGTLNTILRVNANNNEKCKLGVSGMVPPYATNMYCWNPAFFKVLAYSALVMLICKVLSMFYIDTLAIPILSLVLTGLFWPLYCCIKHYYYCEYCHEYNGKGHQCDTFCCGKDYVMASVLRDHKKKAQCKSTRLKPILTMVSSSGVPNVVWLIVVILVVHSMVPPVFAGNPVRMIPRRGTKPPPVASICTEHELRHCRYRIDTVTCDYLVKTFNSTSVTCEHFGILGYPLKSYSEIANSENTESQFDVTPSRSKRSISQHDDFIRPYDNRRPIDITHSVGACQHARVRRAPEMLIPGLGGLSTVIDSNQESTETPASSESERTTEQISVETQDQDPDNHLGITQASRTDLYFLSGDSHKKAILEVDPVIDLQSICSGINSRQAWGELNGYYVIYRADEEVDSIRFAYPTERLFIHAIIKLFARFLPDMAKGINYDYTPGTVLASIRDISFHSMTPGRCDMAHMTYSRLYDVLAKALRTMSEEHKGINHTNYQHYINPRPIAKLYKHIVTKGLHTFGANTMVVRHDIGETRAFEEQLQKRMTPETWSAYSALSFTARRHILMMNCDVAFDPDAKPLVLKGGSLMINGQRRPRKRRSVRPLSISKVPIASIPETLPERPTADFDENMSETLIMKSVTLVDEFVDGVVELTIPAIEGENRLFNVEAKEAHMRLSVYIKNIRCDHKLSQVYKTCKTTAAVMTTKESCTDENACDIPINKTTQLLHAKKIWTEPQHWFCEAPGCLGINTGCLGFVCASIPTEECADVVKPTSTECRVEICIELDNNLKCYNITEGTTTQNIKASWTHQDTSDTVRRNLYAVRKGEVYHGAINELGDFSYSFGSVQILKNDIYFKPDVRAEFRCYAVGYKDVDIRNCVLDTYNLIHTLTRVPTMVYHDSILEEHSLDFGLINIEFQIKGALINEIRNPLEVVVKSMVCKGNAGSGIGYHCLITLETDQAGRATIQCDDSSIPHRYIAIQMGINEIPMLMYRSAPEPKVNCTISTTDGKAKLFHAKMTELRPSHKDILTNNFGSYRRNNYQHRCDSIFCTAVSKIASYFRFGKHLIMYIIAAVLIALGLLVVTLMYRFSQKGMDKVQDAFLMARKSYRPLMGKPKKR